MAVLKTRCPECGVRVRLDVDDEGEHDIEDPPCGHGFTATLDPGRHPAFVRGDFFTPDASRVISVSEDESLRMCDVTSGGSLSTVRLPARPDIVS